MQKLAALLLAMIHFALLPGAALAQYHVGQSGGASAPAGTRTVMVERWVEEWDPVLGRWVRVSEPVVRPVSRTSDIVPAAAITRQGLAASRHALPIPRGVPGAAAALRYGPFQVIDEHRAALLGATDAATPSQFDAMLRDFPDLAMIELVEAPGTSNDIANLALGRRIRAAGIATHVPAGGSVRSGAVELFLAGQARTIAPGALFAVHSWLDSHGREAEDFAPDAPAHRMYIDYYVEMGLSEERARAFYAMTNSVPHASALWLRADEMGRWIGPEWHHGGPQRTLPQRIAAPAPAFSFVEGAIALPAIDLPEPTALARLPGPPAQPGIDYADVTAATLAWGAFGRLEIRRGDVPPTPLQA